MAKRIPVQAPDDEKPTIDELIDRAADRVAARRAPRSDWNRTLQMVSIVLGIVAIVFSAGISWSRIGAVESRMGDVEKRQGVVEQQNRELLSAMGDNKSDLRVLVTKVDALSATVAEIKGQLQRPNPQAR